MRAESHAPAQLGETLVNVAKDIINHGEDGRVDAKRPTGGVQVDADACITAERLARRLEDAVERTMNDLASEPVAWKSPHPAVYDEPSR